MGRPGYSPGVHSVYASQSAVQVGVIGAGHVGLATAAVIASWGTPIILVESNEQRYNQLTAGRASFFEPELDTLLKTVHRSSAFRVSQAVGDLRECEIVLICVGVNVASGGVADLRALEAVLDELIDVLPHDAVVAIKSTVPPGTTLRLAERAAVRRTDLALVSCPEFLREGHGVHDVANPERIVIGGEQRDACERLAAVFAPCGGPVHIVGSTSAELIKYGSNAFLATKISFINELATFCDLLGADVTEVATGIGADPRIGGAFLQPGLGFGGSCFPKDVRALEQAGAEQGYRSRLLQACTEINEQQRQRFVVKIAETLGGELSGRHVAVLGLAFKPQTDDLRQAPALDVISSLVVAGATVTATDPMASGAARELATGATIVEDPYECVEKADVVVIATEWAAYRTLDWARVGRTMAGTAVVDGRNCLDGQALAALGLDYYSVGRPPVRADSR
jgi:UDPglucose 6-dehydrogenase